MDGIFIVIVDIFYCLFSVSDYQYGCLCSNICDFRSLLKVEILGISF